MLVDATTKTFHDYIGKDALTVVDFWATWCGPCKALTPLFEKLANEFNDVAFLKVNVEDEAQIASMFAVTSLPTILFFKEGKVCAHLVGNAGEGKLRNAIEEHR